MQMAGAPSKHCLGRILYIDDGRERDDELHLQHDGPACDQGDARGHADVHVRRRREFGVDALVKHQRRERELHMELAEPALDGGRSSPEIVKAAASHPKSRV